MANSSVCFAYRSDTTSARYIENGNAEMVYRGNTYGSAAEALQATTGAIGGFELDIGRGSTVAKAIFNFNAINTLTFSIVNRFRITAHAGSALQLGSQRPPVMFFTDNSVGDLAGTIINDGNTVVSQVTTTASGSDKLTTTAGFYDHITVIDARTLTAAVTYFVNGSQTGQFNFSAALITNPNGIRGDFFDSVVLGGGGNSTTRTIPNEVVIFRKALTATTIGAMTLVDPSTGVTSTGALNGQSRTGWIDCAKFLGGQWTSISAAEIKIGVNQIQAGLTQTGTYNGADRWTTLTTAQVQSGVSFTADAVGYTGSLTSEVWSTLTAAQIRSGIHQIQNSVTVTGSFTGETWSTLSASDIRAGVNQIQNSVTITGTLSVPTAASGTAGTVDIPNLLEQIRYTLNLNNTTSGYEVIDLSSNLTRRVQNIFKYNPAKIKPDGHQLPALYVYCEKKDILQKTIAKDQVNGKREADVRFGIMGLMWNQSINTTEDPADKDLTYLMENTERVLRSYANLGGYANWQFPTSVEYHTVRLDEQSHLRVGYMSLQCKVYY